MSRGGYRMRTIRDPANDGKPRRVRVETHLGFEGYVTRWTQHCSGCTNTPEMTTPDERGLGCDECGYTGKRRRECFVPFDANGFAHALQAAARAAESECMPGYPHR